MIGIATFQIPKLGFVDSSGKELQMYPFLAICNGYLISFTFPIIAHNTHVRVNGHFSGILLCQAVITEESARTLSEVAAAVCLYNEQCLSLIHI